MSNSAGKTNEIARNSTAMTSRMSSADTPLCTRSSDSAVTARSEGRRAPGGGASRSSLEDSPVDVSFYSRRNQLTDEHEDPFNFDLDLDLDVAEAPRSPEELSLHNRKSLSSGSIRMRLRASSLTLSADSRGLTRGGSTRRSSAASMELHFKCLDSMNQLTAVQFSPRFVPTLEPIPEADEDTD
ncbi:hypothetical protein FVE85_2792 [Porphyridium purpureum]|uniref:Uncharacterized protein n=1 Tax=Porphyridium purpureum TaxID=35688 RepID=A0A5J4YSU6_PORPP|nr:hypothetical protein FVE85_2792 [Porphyridium purpureum]|eukprot:POR1241..scf227_4